MLLHFRLKLRLNRGLRMGAHIPFSQAPKRIQYRLLGRRRRWKFQTNLLTDKIFGKGDNFLKEWFSKFVLRCNLSSRKNLRLRIRAISKPKIHNSVSDNTVFSSTKYSLHLIYLSDYLGRLKTVSNERAKTLVKKRGLYESVLQACWSSDHSDNNLSLPYHFWRNLWKPKIEGEGTS